MATPNRDEYVELQHGVNVLLLGSRAISCRDWSDLERTGPARGSNLTVAGSDGNLLRDHRRGELVVELRDIQVNGSWDEDNVRVYADRRANARTLLRNIRGFIDDAPARKVTVRLTDEDSQYEADAVIVEMGRIDWLSATIAEFSLLLTVPDGRLAEVTS